MIRPMWALVPGAFAVGVLAGAASALFLISLDWVTECRLQHPWLLALLPLAGLAIGWIDLRCAGRAARGTKLIIDEIHNPQSTLPVRMAPLVWLGTLVTHLFGGSAGREGTAVQIATGLGDQAAKTFHFSQGSDERRIMLMAGLSAGFGSVFGVPFAGLIFGLEAPALGRDQKQLIVRAFLPCALASFFAHLITTQVFGIAHTPYTTPVIAPIGVFPAVVTMLAAGAAFGVIARGFTATIHGVGTAFTAFVKWPPARPILGGAIVALAAWALGSDRFLGLGIPSIVEAFHRPAGVYDFALKIFFTAVTLGSGFRGGEVTPLFYIGAASGSAFSNWAPLSTSMMACAGFVAVFAGAARVPFACSVMAVEMFGWSAGSMAAIACFASASACAALRERGIYARD